MHYLIDLDNVLLRTFEVKANGNRVFLWAENLQKDFGFKEPYDGNLLPSDDIFSFGSKEIFIPFLEHFIKEHEASRKISPQELIDYWLERDRIINNQVWDWILAKKKGRNCFHIASNQPDIRMDYLWNRYPEWHSVFDNVFTSAKFGVRKPDSAFFAKILDKLQCKPENICLIDDSLANVEGARKAGMRAVLFKDANDLYALEKSAIAYSNADIAQKIRN